MNINSSSNKKTFNQSQKRILFYHIQVILSGGADHSIAQFKKQRIF
jgi:hypothetical protein